MSLLSVGVGTQMKYCGFFCINFEIFTTSRIGIHSFTFQTRAATTDFRAEFPCGFFLRVIHTFVCIDWLRDSDISADVLVLPRLFFYLVNLVLINLQLENSISLSLSLLFLRFRREYKNIEPIGKGGFGNVFKATSRTDERTYAVKRVELIK